MIEGEKLRLRAPAETDTPAIAAMRNDQALQAAVLGTPHPNTEAMVRDWMAARLKDPQSVFFIVAESASDLPIGYVVVADMHPVHGHGELGICLASAHQGRGHGQEALALLEGYCRGVFGLRKLTLRVRRDNGPAVALYRKAGYREVGVLQAHHYADGAFHDVLIMEKALA
ncbi:MAG: GNAT family N-acetyltransferase [Candidatus Sericytochromatia bacterium]